MKPHPRLLAFLGASLMRLLALTLRFEVRDHAGYFTREQSPPWLIAFWHNRLFAMPIYWWRHGRRRAPARRMVVLTSASRDGTLLAEFVRQFGIGAVRGSSSRGGAAALRELSAVLASGVDVVITPDGPRGPQYAMGAGLAYLAQRTGAPILLVQVDYERCWELRTWDGFRIPKPFSRVTLTLPPVERVGPTEDEAELEVARGRLERLLPG